MRLWEEPVYVKLHGGCGGRVRWVEAVDIPGVGYTGGCVECGTERIPTEEIVPIETRGDAGGFKGEFDIYEDVLELPIEDRRELRWEDEASHDENQARIRQQVVGGEA